MLMTCDGFFWGFDESFPSFDADSNGSRCCITFANAISLLFASLSFYAASAKDRFTMGGAVLSSGLTTMLLFGLAAQVLQWSAFMWAYHVFGATLFSAYIVYDTDKIVHRYDIEKADMGTAIWGALELYLDILNLFMNILRLVSKSKRR